eukprot:jgi/Tetstr1/462118/TSEL_007186.t1
MLAVRHTDGDSLPSEDNAEEAAGNVRNYLARHYFRDVGEDCQGRKKRPLPSEDRLAKARDRAEAVQQSELGKFYQVAGKCPSSNAVFKGEEEVCEVTPHSEAAVPTFGGKPIVSSVQRNKVLLLPLAGTIASPELNATLGGLKQHQKKAGGIIKHNTNAVKSLAAKQAFAGDNVEEGSSPEPPTKKAKQPAKPAAGVPARGRGGAGAKVGVGRSGLRPAASRPPWQQ